MFWQLEKFQLAINISPKKQCLWFVLVEIDPN